MGLFHFPPIVWEIEYDLRAKTLFLIEALFEMGGRFPILKIRFSVAIMDKQSRGGFVRKYGWNCHAALRIATAS